MAKYSNFVGEKGIALNTEEKDKVVAYITKEVEKAFASVNMPTQYMLDNVQVDTISIPYVEGGIKLRFPMFEGHAIYARSFKYRCKAMVNGFSIMLFKRKGYLSNPDGTKDYESAPDFQWNMTISVDGRLIPYSHHCIEGIGLIEHYQYDTELTNLNIRRPMLDLWRYLDGDPLTIKECKMLNPDYTC